MPLDELVTVRRGVGLTALEVEPPLLYPDFDTVSTTRRVEPTSPATGEYVLLVAPEMSAQLAPELSHNRH